MRSLLFLLLFTPAAFGLPLQAPRPLQAPPVKEEAPVIVPFVPYVPPPTVIYAPAPLVTGHGPVCINGECFFPPAATYSAPVFRPAIPVITSHPGIPVIRSAPTIYYPPAPVVYHPAPATVYRPAPTTYHHAPAVRYAAPAVYCPTCR